MHYYILAVSKNRSQLFEVTGDTIVAKPVEGMPANMEAAWDGLERQEKSLQFHSTGNGTSGFHGQGGAKDVVEQEEDRYMHAIAKSLHTLLHEQHDPVVFAGVSEEFGMFRTFDKSGRLLDEAIIGNPDQLRMEELKEKADPIVHKYTMHKNKVFIEEYGNLLGTGRTSTDLAAIMESAEKGKVDLLLVAQGNETKAADAISHTMKHHGRIVMVEEGAIPEGAAIAAILRF